MNTAEYFLLMILISRPCPARCCCGLCEVFAQYCLVTSPLDAERPGRGQRHRIGQLGGAAPCVWRLHSVFFFSACVPYIFALFPWADFRHLFLHVFTIESVSHLRPRLSGSIRCISPISPISCIYCILLWRMWNTKRWTHSSDRPLEVSTRNTKRLHCFCVPCVKLKRPLLAGSRRKGISDHGWSKAHAQCAARISQFLKSQVFLCKRSSTLKIKLFSPIGYWNLRPWKP